MNDRTILFLVILLDKTVSTLNRIRQSLRYDARLAYVSPTFLKTEKRRKKRAFVTVLSEQFEEGPPDRHHYRGRRVWGILKVGYNILLA